MPSRTLLHYTTESENANIAMMYTSCQQVHKTEEESMNYEEIEDVMHITRNNSSTTCTTFSNELSNQHEFRYSSDVLSIGDSSHYSENTNIDAASSKENVLEEVYPWIDSVRSELFVDEESGYEITRDKTEDQLLQDTGINALGRRRKISNSLKSVKNTLLDAAISPNNSMESSNGIYYRNASERTTNGSRSRKYHANSSLNLSVSSLSLDEQLQCRSYCKCRGNTSSDGCFSNCANECNSLALSQLSQCNEGKHIGDTRPIFETSIISSKETRSNNLNTTTAASTVAPLTPPASLIDMNFEQISHESQFIQEGWMFKQSRHFKTWNKRWFVLHENRLYYFKNSKDMKVRGVIQLEGYRITLDPPCLNKKKKYGFNLSHDHMRSFSFYVNTLSEMKEWVQILLKGTIKRNFATPVISTNTDTTISLETAQLMKPRPPSILMCSIAEFNKRHQQYRDSVMRDVLNSNLEEELDETLLWIEHPHHRGKPFEALVIYPCHSIEDSQSEQIHLSH